MIDATGFTYRTGTPWRDLPERFGSRKGAHDRPRKWATDGTREKAFTALLARADTEGDLDRVVAADSTIVRAHQHAAGARRRGPGRSPRRRRLHPVGKVIRKKPPGPSSRSSPPPGHLAARPGRAPGALRRLSPARCGGTSPRSRAGAL
ncbi:transposase [Streptomyces sp. NPDC057052]|uniref:transposase n=1 Tax=Streptomyces sp. NPDC057052 TaxID=3346010 RepID=UPI003631969E